MEFGFINLSVGTRIIIYYIVHISAIYKTMLSLYNTPILLILIACVLGSVIDNQIEQCNLPEKLVEEIASYGKIVAKISNCVLRGPCKHSTYNHLAEFIDTFGNRIAGSKNLEDAIDYMLNKSVNFNLENVHGEEANVTHWIRYVKKIIVVHCTICPIIPEQS